MDYKENNKKIKSSIIGVISFILSSLPLIILLWFVTKAILNYDAESQLFFGAIHSGITNFWGEYWKIILFIDAISLILGIWSYKIKKNTFVLFSIFFSFLPTLIIIFSYIFMILIMIFIFTFAGI